jgi:3-phosphoshikimate 1-carboxyvinyltransferase
MNLTVFPGSPLHGEVTLAGDKSLSHRAALFAALAEGESCIGNFQVSGVTRSMLSALSGLGVDWSVEGTRLRVSGKGWRQFTPPCQPLDCGNSATTLRLLTGALAASGVPAVLDGSPGLRKRPMGRILEPLRQMGVPVSGTAGDCAPLRLEARSELQPLKGIQYRLPVASAQVKSCLLLAGLAAGQPLVLHEPSPSRDHTERMLNAMGCRVDTQPGPGGQGSTVILTPPSAPLQPVELSIPGDISSAAFLIVAALITPESQIRLKNVGLNPTRTGILDVLQAMGADIQVEVQGEQAGEPYGEVITCSSQLTGTRVSGDLVVRMIDEFPIFAIAASYAQGATEVKDAAELRFKESDRISALCQELNALSVQTVETRDGFTLQGGHPLRGGPVQPHGDHRLAMALAVAGLAAQDAVCVQGADIIRESFPEFASTLQSLGAHLNEEVHHAA